MARYNEGVPKLTILPAGVTVEFDPATMPYTHHGKRCSILDICLNNGIELEHACGGSCACTTCHVVVESGMENLSEMDDDEADRVEQAADVGLRSRLGCQAAAAGDVTVTIPSWNRNYISEGGKSLNLGDAIPPPRVS